MVANRKNLLIVIFGILTLAAVWIAVLKPSVNFKKVFSFGGGENVERITPSIFDKQEDYLALIASARQTKKSFVYEASGHRDPMVPLVAARRVRPRGYTGGKRPPKLFLEGIIWSQNEPVAVINGTILKEHDFIRGAKVLQIDRDSVTLLYRSQRIVLRLE